MVLVLVQEQVLLALALGPQQVSLLMQVRVELLVVVGLVLP